MAAARPAGVSVAAAVVILVAAEVGAAACENAHLRRILSLAPVDFEKCVVEASEMQHGLKWMKKR